MRTIAAAVCAMALVVLAKPEVAQAGYMSGNTLYADCSAEKSDSVYYSKMARCSGYIIGAVDAWDLGALMSGRKECVPASVTIGQLNDIVIAYLRANPHQRHYNASNLVALAINEAFGCAILPTVKP